jgi:hypothetical protein
MVPSGHKSLKEIAWNGIRFLAPINWEPAHIGTHYLVLQNSAGPILEVKWGRIKGNFSHAAHFKRLITHHKKRLGKTIREVKLSADLKKALEAYEVSGFSWQGQILGGKGVILYCPVCRNATLIQFYGSGSDKTDRIAADLLASFQDHRHDDHILWSVFDIQARLPAGFRLMRHRFEAGQFELRFGAKGHLVILNRWGPASILLADKDLVQFAQSAIRNLPTPPPAGIGNDTALEWMIPRAAGIGSRWFNRIKKPSLQQIRIWHLGDKNRILGVRTEGRRPMDPAFFENICAGFNSV